jgi:transcriptional regulator with XRE-family HTH domain
VLAQKAGLSVSYLSLLESGKREPSLQAMRDIAQALGIPLFALLALAMPLEDLKAIPGSANSKLLEALMLLLEEGGGFAPCLSPQPDSES